MKKFLLSLLVLPLLLVSCNEEPPNTAQPFPYQLGVHSLLYPGNWKIIGDDEENGFQSVFFNTTAGGILIVKSYPISKSIPIADFAKEFSKCTSGVDAVGNINSLGFSKHVTGETYSSINETFNMNYMGKNIHFTRLYKSMDTSGDRRAYVILQAPTDKIGLLYPGFEFVYQSLNQ